MGQRVTPNLPDTLLSLLKEGSPALLLTTGADSFPNTAYTWVIAPDAHTVRFGADIGSATLANLEREQRASIQIIAPGNLVFLIKGTARQIKAQIESAPFKIAMIALAVTEVKDQSWPGITVSPLAYTWPLEQQEDMLAMERNIYDEMSKWSG